MPAFRFDDPDQYVRGTPYEALARLRKESPFAWHASFRPSSEGFWLATKHRHIISISRNPELFATSAPLLADPLPAELWPQNPALAMIADNLMTFKRGKHSIFRSIANTLFSAAKIAAAKNEVRRACVEVIVRMSGRTYFDFAEDVALPLAVETVLGIFLGVPRQDLPGLTRSVLAINAMDDPFFRPRPETFIHAAEDLFAYGMTLLRRMKDKAHNDFFVELIERMTLSGLSPEQMVLAYWFPLVAGAFDTTASTIAGGVQALLRFPEQLNRLCADPDAIPLAVDEMLRWVSPVVYFRRTATSDTDFEGNRIKKGQKIVLCYASANRDEDVFVNPDSFDVCRNPNNHVSFGHGPHFCVGARLASMILRTFLEEFLPRMTGIQIDGRVLHTRSAWMNRIRSMPVRNFHATQGHGT